MNWKLKREQEKSKGGLKKMLEMLKTVERGG